MARPAAAQTPPSPGDVTVVHPTDNGYDDLMAACAALSPASPAGSTATDATLPSSDAIGKAFLTNATLAEKRAALRDRRAQTALALLRTALGKPRLVPPTERLLHSMIAVLPLAHLLNIEEYLLLADGSTASAVETFDELLALGDDLQRWSIGGAKIGQSLVESGAETLATHLGRLSAGDCSRLQDLLKREMDDPNPALAGFEAGKSIALQPITAFLHAPDKPTDEASLKSEDTPDADVQAELRLKHASAEEQHAFLDAVKRDAALYMDFMEANLSAYPDLSTGEPTGISTQRSENDALADKIARMAVSFGTGRWRAERADRFVAYRARLQLLALHAAIGRYRWEHNALPDSLAALEIGPLANDPFTKGGIEYTRAKDGKSYALSCAGPPARDDNGKPIPGGTRTQVTLP